MKPDIPKNFAEVKSDSYSDSVSPCSRILPKLNKLGSTALSNRSMRFSSAISVGDSHGGVKFSL